VNRPTTTPSLEYRIANCITGSSTSCVVSGLGQDQGPPVYGVRKVWRQLQREGVPVARCTVARLMRDMGLAGVIRGKPVRTTVSDKAAPCSLDRINCQFRAPAPNMLWVSDFTYVSTWSGFVYVAFVIDVFARRIAGWRASRSAHAGFVLDALEQALHEQRPVGGKLVHHRAPGPSSFFRKCHISSTSTVTTDEGTTSSGKAAASARTHFSTATSLTPSTRPIMLKLTPPPALFHRLRRWNLQAPPPMPYSRMAKAFIAGGLPRKGVSVKWHPHLRQRYRCCPRAMPLFV